MTRSTLAPLMIGLLISGFAQANNPACIDECAIAFVNKNYPVALRECTAAAEYGHVPAQRFVGTMYAAGWGTQKDYAKSAMWLRKAADQGDVTAQKYLSKLEGKPYQPSVRQVVAQTGQEPKAPQVNVQEAVQITGSKPTAERLPALSQEPQVASQPAWQLSTGSSSETSANAGSELINNDNPVDMFNMAIKLEEGGQIERSMEIYQAILVKFPKHVISSQSRDIVDSFKRDTSSIKFPDWVSSNIEKDNYYKYLNRLNFWVGRYVSEPNGNEKSIIRARIEKMFHSYGETFAAETWKKMSIDRLSPDVFRPNIRAYAEKGECDKLSDIKYMVRGLNNGEMENALIKCEKNRKFQIAVTKNSPQALYIAASEFEDSDDRIYAKVLYQEILKRFPESPIALKASDSLAAMKRSEHIEIATGSVRQRAEEAESRAAEAEARARAAEAAAAAANQELRRPKSCSSAGGVISCY